MTAAVNTSDALAAQEPDITVSVRQIFGIESDMEVPLSADFFWPKQ